jgi:hypothetical protein
MKQVIFNPYNKKISSIELSQEEQMKCIQDLYEKRSEINIQETKSETKSTSNHKNIISVLKKKFSSYKSQDKQSHKYDIEQHITFNEMIEKLYTSKLKCYYCNCDLIILYNKKREKTQWTLERLDNNLGHYKSNTCICCLDCNLKRRTDNHEYFKNSKQTIIKMIK